MSAWPRKDKFSWGYGSWTRVLESISLQSGSLMDILGDGTAIREDWRGSERIEGDGGREG